MASGTTGNYQLSQWSATDQVRMADFNADNQKLDAALKALDSTAAAAPKVTMGSYQGTGTHGESNPNSITFPFPPLFVLITAADEQLFYTMTLIRGMTKARVYCNFINASGVAENTLTWNENTLSWYCADKSDMQLNSNRTYYYFAIG